jgi:hypothetical protein
MTFLLQFIRIRHGVRVVTRTVTVEARDSNAALARATSWIATSHLWPVNTDALRLMDDGGRTLLDWSMPAASSPHVIAEAPIHGRASASQSLPSVLTREVDPAHTDHSHLAVGQAISYAQDGRPEIWMGGYQIVAEAEPIDGEAQYTIRNADETHDRVVSEHELREDLGARTRGQ